MDSRAGGNDKNGIGSVPANYLRDVCAGMTQVRVASQPAKGTSRRRRSDGSVGTPPCRVWSTQGPLAACWMRTRMTIGGGLVDQGIDLSAVADGAGTSGTTMTPIQRVRFVVSRYLGPNVA